MKALSRRFLFALTLALAVMSGTAQAGTKPLSPDASARGTSYADLTAAWLEWTTAVPASINPILDADGTFAGEGQTGKIWFLTGTTTGGSVTRHVTIPAGTALFFPIVNYFWVNTPEYGDPAWSPEQEAAVRDLMAEVVDTAENLVLQIDGQAVPNLDALRVSGSVGACTLPDENIFGLVFDPGPHDCVADGYWALLPPLSVGQHTIHFSGGFSSPAFELDVTYEITVSAH